MVQRRVLWSEPLTCGEKPAFETNVPQRSGNALEESEETCGCHGEKVKGSTLLECGITKPHALELLRINWILYTSHQSPKSAGPQHTKGKARSLMKHLSIILHEDPGTHRGWVRDFLFSLVATPSCGRDMPCLQRICTQGEQENEMEAALKRRSLNGKAGQNKIHKEDYYKPM